MTLYSSQSLNSYSMDSRTFINTSPDFIKYNPPEIIQYKLEFKKPTE